MSDFAKGMTGEGIMGEAAGAARCAGEGDHGNGKVNAAAGSVTRDYSGDEESCVGDGDMDITKAIGEGLEIGAGLPEETPQHTHNPPAHCMPPLAPALVVDKRQFPELTRLSVRAAQTLPHACAAAHTLGAQAGKFAYPCAFGGAKMTPCPPIGVLAVAIRVVEGSMRAVPRPTTG